MCDWEPRTFLFDYQARCRVPALPGTSLCIFHSPHSPDDAKDVEEFRRQLYQQLDETGSRETRNSRLWFAGYVFPRRVVCQDDRDGGRALVLPRELEERVAFEEEGFLRDGGGALVLPRELEEGVTFKEAEFLRCADFLDAKFQGNADFEEATFWEDAVFEGATIGGAALFQGATFGVYALFEKSTFGDLAFFERAQFKSRADFGRATLKGWAVFEGAAFQKQALFYGAKFVGGVDFGGETFGEAKFVGDVDFGGATFEKDANFGKATFDGDTSFLGAAFTTVGRFAGTTFEKDADFTGVTFEKDADFRGVMFEKDADFEEATFGGNVDFGMTTFKNGAYFKHCEARRIGFDIGYGFGLSRPTIHPLMPCRTGLRGMSKRAGPSFWEFVRRTCENGGLRERADAAYYFEKVWYRYAAVLCMGVSGCIGYPLDLLLRWSIGYGTSFSRTLTSWLIVILGFGAGYAGFPSVLGRRPDCIWTLSNWASGIFASGSCFAKLALASHEAIPAAGKALLLSESIVGSVLVALTVAVIARKVMR